MTLVKLTDVPQRSTDFVARESRVARWSAVLFVAAILTGVAIFTYREPIYILYFAVAFLLLMLWFFVQMLRACYLPTNWLMRIAADGTVWIKFRSYLNHHLPADEPQVVRLNRGEIGSARLVKETLRTLDGGRGRRRQVQWVTCIDLAVTADTLEPLAARLAGERSKPLGRASRNKSFYHDVPLFITEGGALRLKWHDRSRRTTPSPEAALAALARVTTVLPPEEVEMDHTRSSGGNDELERQVIELIARGETFAAVGLVRQRYQMSLAQARQFVEELTRRGPAA